jgi:hypothetical protein
VIDDIFIKNLKKISIFQMNHSKYWQKEMTLTILTKQRERMK